LNAADRVKFALQDGPMFPSELVETTGLALKTVKNALTKLREAETVLPTGTTNNTGAKQVSLVSPPLRDKDKDTPAGRESASRDGETFNELAEPALMGAQHEC
jgi:hypothetical protein